MLFWSATACGGPAYSGRGAGRQSSVIDVTQVMCYVVCDSLEAHIQPTGITFRREAGAIMGPGRVPSPRRGTDTVVADQASLDSLRASLRTITMLGLGTTYRQGVPPCDSIMTSHTPIVAIAWSDGHATHHLQYDVGCRERTGLLQTTARYAQQAALFRGIPVRSQ